MENQVITSQNNSVTALLDKLKLVDSVVSQATALNVEGTNLQLEAEKERKNADFAKRNRILIPLVVLFAGFFVIAILSPIAAIIVAIIMWKPKHGPQPHLDKAEDCEQKSKSKFELSNMLVQEHLNDLAIIPQKYWYPIATNFLVEVIQTGRATTLPVALDKLEEQIHRWNMESAMHQTLNLQIAQTEALRRIEINTTASVIADVADLFL